MRPFLEYCIQLWGPQYKTGMDLSEQVRRLEHPFYEERLTELELFSLEKKSSRETLFQYLKGTYKNNGERLFTKACTDRRRNNGFKLEERRFRLDRRKTFFL